VLCPDVPLKVINAINFRLDQPSAIYGPSHRRFNHDLLSASVIGAQVALAMGCTAEQGVRVAAAHLLEDSVSDKMVKVVTPFLIRGRGRQRKVKRLTAKHIFDALTSQM
jgi:hypothetical protein